MSKTDSAQSEAGSRHTIYLGGIHLDVYGPPKVMDTLVDPDQDTGSADVLVMMHGRENTRKSLRGICLQLVEEANDSTLTDPSVPFIVITFDQPNHGERTINTQRNLSWKQGNPHYGLDMWTCIIQSLNDLRMIMDYFPSYVRLNVRRWAVGGISMGGHATAMALAEDPRIDMGMVLIGCGNLSRRFAIGATKNNIPAHRMSVVLTESRRRDATLNADRVVGIYAPNDPSNVVNRSERWILVLHGAADEVVPLQENLPFIQALRERMHETIDTAHHAQLASTTSTQTNTHPVYHTDSVTAKSDSSMINVGRINAPSKTGRLCVNIYPGVGHHVNRDMRYAMVRWIREWRVASTRHASPSVSQSSGKL